MTDNLYGAGIKAPAEFGSIALQEQHYARIFDLRHVLSRLKTLMVSGDRRASRSAGLAWRAQALNTGEVDAPVQVFV